MPRSDVPMTFLDRLVYVKLQLAGRTAGLIVFCLCYLIQLALWLALRGRYEHVTIEKTFFRHFVIQAGALVFPALAYLHYAIAYRDNVNASSVLNSYFFRCDVSLSDLFLTLVDGLSVIGWGIAAAALVYLQHNSFATLGNSLHYINGKPTFIAYYYYCIFFFFCVWWGSSLTFHNVVLLVNLFKRRSYEFKLEPFDPLRLSGLERYRNYLNKWFFLLSLIGIFLVSCNINWVDVRGVITPAIGKGDAVLYSVYCFYVAVTVTIPGLYWYHKISLEKKRFLSELQFQYFREWRELRDSANRQNYVMLVYQRVEQITPWIVDLRQKWILSGALSLASHILGR